MTITASNDVETLLVVEACREQPDDRARDVLERLIAAHPDWTRVFTIAMWNKVLFLMFERLRDLRLFDRSLRDGGLPLLVYNHWKQLFRVNLERNKTQAFELARVAECLERAGVRYAVGKGGPLLIGRCYRQSERKSYDIDLLGTKEQLEPLRSAMQAAGYGHANYSHDTGEYSELPHGEVRKWLMHARGLPNFVRRVDALHMDYVVVQVQFKVGSTVEGGWRDAGVMVDRAVRGADGIRGVCDSDLLVQLCLHVYRETHEQSFDDWSMSWNLIKFCDLARFTRFLSTAPSRAGVAARVKELGFVPQCVYALDLLQRVLPDESSARLLAELDPDASVRRTQQDATASPVDPIARIAQVGRGTQAKESRWSRLMEPQTT